MAYTAAVEIFKRDAASQWYVTEPLPVACEDISLVSIGNTRYALGGWQNNSESHLNQALHATVDDLVCITAPASENTRSSESDTCSMLYCRLRAGMARKIEELRKISTSEKKKNQSIKQDLNPLHSVPHTRVPTTTPPLLIVAAANH